MDWAKTTSSRDEKHLSFGVCCCRETCHLFPWSVEISYIWYHLSFFCETCPAFHWSFRMQFQCKQRNLKFVIKLSLPSQAAQEIVLTTIPVTIRWGRSSGVSEQHETFLMWFNSLWPSDVIRRHNSGSTLAQVMACFLLTPSHYLNQCWLVLSKVQWHSSEGNFARDTSGIGD